MCVRFQEVIQLVFQYLRFTLMQAKYTNFKYWSDLGHGDASCHVLLAGGTDTLRLALGKGIML